MLVGLTPFVEGQALWEQISNPNAPNTDGTTATRPAMGPSPDHATYGPWHAEIPTLRCPSDPGTGLPAKGRTNYAACLGDCSPNMTHGPMADVWTVQSAVAQRSRAYCRGAFVPGQKAAFRDILDGLANTIIMGEITTDLGDRDKRTSAATGAAAVGALTPTLCGAGTDASRPQFWGTTVGIATTNSAHGRGYRWADGNPSYTVMQTISPPNSATCNTTAQGKQDNTGLIGDPGNADQLYGIFPPSSRHQGGCHVLMGDGAVKYITDSIEAGSPDALQVGFTLTAVGRAPGSQSQYGLWGSLGTRASKEVIKEEL